MFVAEFRFSVKFSLVVGGAGGGVEIGSFTDIIKLRKGN